MSLYQSGIDDIPPLRTRPRVGAMDQGTARTAVIVPIGLGVLILALMARSMSRAADRHERYQDRGMLNSREYRRLR